MLRIGADGGKVFEFSGYLNKITELVCSALCRVLYTEGATQSKIEHKKIRKS